MSLGGHSGDMSHEDPPAWCRMRSSKKWRLSWSHEKHDSSNFGMQAFFSYLNAKNLTLTINEVAISVRLFLHCNEAKFVMQNMQQKNVNAHKDAQKYADWIL